MTDIIVDWGSTNFRAFLVEKGQVIDRHVSGGKGVLQLHSQRGSMGRPAFYSGILHGCLNPWLSKNASLDIFMCGAIGSQEGWVDTGYSEAPADLQKLAQNLRFLTPEEAGEITGRNISILPGLAIDRQGRHDMMRSEEIKSLGALFHLGLEDGVLCIPGTHCKWVIVRNGKIAEFHSALTGEIYSTMQTVGSLAPLFPAEGAEFSYDAFEQGLALADEGHDLLVDIWQVRSRRIRTHYPPQHLKSFLSGILIGHELRETGNFIKTGERIILLSDPGSRRDYYERAIVNAGWTISHIVESEQTVCTGMLRLIEAYRQL